MPFVVVATVLALVVATVVGVALLVFGRWLYPGAFSQPNFLERRGSEVGRIGRPRS